MDQDFDRNRNRDRDDEDYRNEGDINRRRMPRRDRGMRGQEDEPRDRGYYGRGYGYGESPYTSHPPDYNQRISSGESPYTDYGPRVSYRGGQGESPYTRQRPTNYSNRYSSGESPYTDYGPTQRQGRDMDYGDYWDYEPESFTYEEFWLIPGPMTGRGPQGYNRSDERILEDIMYRLTMHGQLDASTIAVTVNNGEVTLSGEVRSRRGKRIAEDVVDSVTGVKDVHNQIKVTSEDRQKMGGSESQF